MCWLEKAHIDIVNLQQVIDGRCNLPFKLVHYNKSSLCSVLQNILLNHTICHNDLFDVLVIVSRVDRCFGDWVMCQSLGNTSGVATLGFPLVYKLQGEEIASEAPRQNCCNLSLVIGTTDFDWPQSLLVHCPCLAWSLMNSRFVPV